MEQNLYAQVIMFWCKDLKFDAADKNKTHLSLNFKVNPQDQDIGLIFIQIGLKSILSLENLISIRNFFKIMTKSKKQIHS